MPSLLDVLILEDRPADAELVLYELRRAGFDPRWERVETEADYVARLRPDLDVILSDYSMPQFDAPRALSLLQENRLDIPFIVITGTVSEEAAVECMKRGAADYLLKDRLGRLGQAVTQALERKRERQRAERRLRESEERFRLIVEGMRDHAIFILDPEGRIASWNKGAERLKGYRTEEIIGRHHSVCHTAEDVAQGMTGRALEEAKRQGWYEHECRVVRKDGSTFWVREIITASRGDEGILRGFVAINRDITDRKLTEERLRESEEQLRMSQKLEAIGQLAGGVAHDFNNMLTVITGYADLLLSRLQEGDPMRQHVEEIKKAGARSAALTRQLLAFSRKQVLQPKVLDLNAVVVDMDKMLRRLIGEDVELLTALDPALGRVKADPGQIEQVVMNLAVNSRDAMPEGGKLIIQTANVELDSSYASQHIAVRPGRYSMLAVSDSGRGMDAETQSRVFEPFFTTKEQGKGTGLGLATVYGIIKQSGGNIWLYSEPGHGTTFKIYLPQADEGEAEEPGPEAASAEPLRGSETVLLVEDEERVRKFIREILQMKGYFVLEAGNGREALSVCGRHEGSINLVLTDVVMPQMGGPDLASRLAPLHPEAKVLFMSGYTDESIVHHGILDPGVAFIEKPFTPDALARKIREVLGGGA